MLTIISNPREGKGRDVDDARYKRKGRNVWPTELAVGADDVILTVKSVKSGRRIAPPKIVGRGGDRCPGLHLAAGRPHFVGLTVFDKSASQGPLLLVAYIGAVADLCNLVFQRLDIQRKGRR